MSNKKYILVITSIVAIVIFLSACGSDKAMFMEKEEYVKLSQNNVIAIQPKEISNIKFLEKVKPESKSTTIEKKTLSKKEDPEEITPSGNKTNDPVTIEKIEEDVQIQKKETNKTTKNQQNSEEDKEVKPEPPVKKEEPKKEMFKQTVLDVPYINQYSPKYAPMGCEGASLLMALKYKTGTGIGLKQFLDAMPKNENNPYTAYASTPYEIVDGVFQSIFPAPLTAYGQQYSGGVANVSGYSVNQLKAELDNGNPIVVFVTLDFAQPTWKKWKMGGEMKNMVSNLHVVLLTGYNSKGNYHVTDPAGRGKYWVSKSRFETAYNALQWGVVVR